MYRTEPKRTDNSHSMYYPILFLNNDHVQIAGLKFDNTDKMMNQKNHDEHFKTLYFTQKFIKLDTRTAATTIKMYKKKLLCIISEIVC